MDDEVLGPVDYLAVEWPGAHVTGEGFQLLLDLVERGIVRVLDRAGLEAASCECYGVIKQEYDRLLGPAG